jgi:hypothetical protein
VRPEHKEIAATSITSPRKIAFAEKKREADQISFLGRPKALGKNQAEALNETRRGTGSGITGRIRRITSGRTRGQQGLVATCKDSLNEVNNQSRGEPNGFGEWVGKSDD